MGPGVGMPVVFLSPGVLNSAGRPNKTTAAGNAHHRDPSRLAAAHGPAIQATTSMTKRVPEDANVSKGLTPGRAAFERSGNGVIGA